MSRFSPLHAPHLTAEVRERAADRLEFLYSSAVTNWPGFIEREGQLTLMKTTLEVLLCAKTGDNTVRDGANLAALEAGTGTGKTLGYCLAAIVASEILGMKVVISTATVALQEQLFFKDLPQLATFIPELSFELLKGRGRYVCKSRLESALTGEVQGDWLDIEDAHSEQNESGAAPLDKPRRLEDQTVLWLKDLDKALNADKWDGEFDSMGVVPDAADWRAIQADAAACHGGQCEHFKECAFFKARRKAQAATFQVANHALVLAALAGESSLIDPENTLFIMDEGHHLPDIANEQFSYRARLGQSQKVISAMRRAMTAAVRLLPVADRPNLAPTGELLAGIREKLDFMTFSLLESDLIGPDNPTHRFAHGAIEDEVRAECEQLARLLTSAIETLAQLHSQLSQSDESMSPKEKDERGRAASSLGPHLQRMTTLRQLFQSWAAQDAVPLAKWIEWVDTSASPDALMCASPLTGAHGLVKGLWRQVAAAVCTSATLTACGSFDFFERLSGLNRFTKRRTGVMPSPFDYARQGQLRLPALKNTPKSPAFSQELCQRLPDLLSDHPLGQLVLFTSRRQMDACYAALPEGLQSRILMQGARSRQALLKEHRQRVDNGESSVLFGLQSMGEGLDLPGALCEHVLIDKLPFTPPSSPVDEALSEWLATQGRDAFDEIVVPRAAMRLAQWVGRGVRTVNDYARITICDTRLSKTGFGRRMLAGLPPFERVAA